MQSGLVHINIWCELKKAVTMMDEGECPDRAGIVQYYTHRYHCTRYHKHHCYVITTGIPKAAG